MSIPWLVLSGLALLYLAVALVLGAMLERSGPIRLRHWVEEAGGGLRRLYEHPAYFEAFRFLLSFAAKTAPLVLFLCLLAAIHPPLPFATWYPWVTGLVVVLLVAVGEMVNRRLVGYDPERVLRRLTRLYSWALLLARPFVLLLGPLMPSGSFERSDEDEDDASYEEIDEFIAVGAREGILEPEEVELVRSVVDFGDTKVRSVMTPRIDMVCMPVEADLDALAEVFLQSNHSRVPLFDGSIDQVVGVLHLRDLLRGLRAQEPISARELAHPVWYVPETKPLDEVLAELQERHQQMAVVVDEYGGTAGLVTVEDLLEEIVGEIVDEADSLPPQSAQLSDGSWRFEGRAHVEALDDAFSVDLDDAPFETIGGMIMSAFGYVPSEGENIDAYGLRMTVEKVDERRILSVLVAPLPAAEGEEVGADG
jgi:CBS domain containing-hemolysin-like protein